MHSLKMSVSVLSNLEIEDLQERPAEIIASYAILITFHLDILL